MISFEFSSWAWVFEGTDIPQWLRRNLPVVYESSRRKYEGPAIYGRPALVLIEDEVLATEFALTFGGMYLSTYRSSSVVSTRLNRNLIEDVDP